MGLDMSINGGEFDLEGTQFTAYFTAKDRVDFRNLVRDLSRDLGARVQLLQVGDRDRAKLVDGIDICGERLCCSSLDDELPRREHPHGEGAGPAAQPAEDLRRLRPALLLPDLRVRGLQGAARHAAQGRLFLSTPAGEAKVTGIDFNREMVKLWLVDQREQVEVAAIDFQLQHGVTIRPMELVRKIEGPMRTVFEDGQPARAPAAP